MARDSIAYVKRRMLAFLSDYQQPGEPWASFLARKHVASVLKRLRVDHVSAYLVGGTIRDLCCAPMGVLPRDIDVIVEGMSQGELRKMFDDIFQRETRFGGLHLVSQRVLKEGISTRFSVMFDVWRLQDTWALRKFGSDATIQQFPCSTFLNLDSAAVELWRSDSRGREVLDCGFFDALKSRSIEINFADNPFPAVCAVRSLIVAAKLQFMLGDSVVSFLTDRAINLTPAALMEAQLSHYGFKRCSEEELETWLSLVYERKKLGCRTISLPVTAERQLELWSWPQFEEHTSEEDLQEGSCTRPLPTRRGATRSRSQLQLFAEIPTTRKGH